MTPQGGTEIQHRFLSHYVDEKLLYNFYKNKGYYNVSVESSSAKVIDESNFELIFPVRLRLVASGFIIESVCSELLIIIFY